MKFSNFASLASLVLTSVCFASDAKMHFNPAGFDRTVQIQMLDGSLKLKPAQLRTGIYPETGTLKACALYLEGFADSVRNQGALFELLAENGVRTVFFDYPGQGASEGHMNDTRVVDPLLKHNQISEMADTIWSRALTGPAQDCSGKKKILVGWSTGGLAAYLMAADGKADAVILLAPGLSVKPLVGELSKKPWLLGNIHAPVITSRALTTASEWGFEPHLDPPSPTHPLQAPLFVKNLASSGAVSAIKSIPKTIPGVALFASEDTFVSTSLSSAILELKSPHLVRYVIQGARHELANERTDLQSQAFQAIRNFLQTL